MDIFLATLLGLLFGSFLNVIILRIPKEQSIVFPSSHCFNCGKNLKPWHNIPLLSWIFLRGKCAFCKSEISLQYPLVELLSALLFFTLSIKYGSSLPLFFISLSFLMLLALSIIDIRYKMVPDSLNLLAILFAILGAWSLDGVIENFYNALLFAGAFTLLRFCLSYYLTSSARAKAKKTLTSWSKNYHPYPFIEAMGEGDIMVGATMGALLGVKLALVAIFLSCLLALPIMLCVLGLSKEKQKVPFVPFLALGTFIVYIYDTPIIAYIEANY